MGTLVFQYGSMSPPAGALLVREQLWLAHRYRNLLTEAACARRCVERELEAASGLTPALAALAAAAEALDAGLAALKKGRVDKRSKADTAEARANVATLRTVKSDASAAVRCVRSEMRESLQAERDAISERWNALVRGARALSGLRHGTYTLVEESIAQACGKPLWDDGQPNDPHFCRWTGEGTIGVQVQGGVTWTDLDSEQDTRVQIGPWQAPSDGRRFGRSARMARCLRLRVGSNEDRSPIWAEWQMIMHRPLPPNAIVMRANVSVRRIGPRERWTCELTVRVPDGQHAEHCGNGGAVALDLGWRSLDGGDEYRIGSWLGEDGASGECRVGQDVRGELRKVDDICSIRDKNRDEIRSRLCAWEHGAVVPEWFVLATQHMHQWEQPARFVGLLKRWGENRFDGNAEEYEALRAWAYHDRHLWCWETSSRSKALKRRREQYRLFAVGLARRYNTLVLEDFELPPVVQRKPAERQPSDPEDVARDDKQSRNRFAVAPAELRMCLIQAFAMRGGISRAFAPEGTTYLCHRCGHDCREDKGWKPARWLSWTCGGCKGQPWDQDANAAENLLAMWRERPGDARDAAGARRPKRPIDPEHVGESRRERVARMRVAKLARMEAARKPDGKAT